MRAHTKPTKQTKTKNQQTNNHGCDSDRIPFAALLLRCPALSGLASSARRMCSSLFALRVCDARKHLIIIRAICAQSHCTFLYTLSVFVCECECAFYASRISYWLDDVFCVHIRPCRLVRVSNQSDLSSASRTKLSPFSMSTSLQRFDRRQHRFTSHHHAVIIIDILRLPMITIAGNDSCRHRMPGNQLCFSTLRRSSSEIHVLYSCSN